MRKLKLSLAIVAIIGIITACKKNDASPSPTSTSVEAWMGTWDPISGDPAFFALNLHDNGRLLAQISQYDDTQFPDETDICIGTWTQQGDSIKATIKRELNQGQISSYTEDSIFSISFKKSSATQAVGTIGEKTATAGLGSFNITKFNNSSILGSWGGTYNLNDNAKSLPYALHFNQGISFGSTYRGIVIEATDPSNPNKISISLGEWGLQGNNVLINVFDNPNSDDPTTVSTIAGSYSNGAITMNGTFGQGTNITGLGSFQVQRK